MARRLSRFDTVSGSSSHAREMGAPLSRGSTRRARSEMWTGSTSPTTVKVMLAGV